MATRSPLSFLFLRLNIPNSLRLSSYVRCSSTADHLCGLPWAHASVSMMSNTPDVASHVSDRRGPLSSSLLLLQPGCKAHVPVHAYLHTKVLQSCFPESPTSTAASGTVWRERLTFILQIEIFSVSSVPDTIQGMLGSYCSLLGRSGSPLFEMRFGNRKRLLWWCYIPACCFSLCKKCWNSAKF